MNYKLEKFWNNKNIKGDGAVLIWTINLKSFEIEFNEGMNKKVNKMNYKLEKFWNHTFFQ